MRMIYVMFSPTLARAKVVVKLSRTENLEMRDRTAVARELAQSFGTYDIFIYNSHVTVRVWECVRV